MHAPCHTAATSGVHGFDVNPTTDGMTLLGPESACNQPRAQIYSVRVYTYTSECMSSALNTSP